MWKAGICQSQKSAGGNLGEKEGGSSTWKLNKVAGNGKIEKAKRCLKSMIRPRFGLGQPPDIQNDLLKLRYANRSPILPPAREPLRVCASRTVL